MLLSDPGGFNSARPEPPDSDAEQQFLLRNHLDLLAHMLRDGLRFGRSPATVLAAAENVLGRVHDYLTQQEERPTSWAISRGFPLAISDLRRDTAGIDPLQEEECRRSLDELASSVEFLVQRCLFPDS